MYIEDNKYYREGWHASEEEKNPYTRHPNPETRPQLKANEAHDMWNDGRKDRAQAPKVLECKAYKAGPDSRVTACLYEDGSYVLHWRRKTSYRTVKDTRVKLSPGGIHATMFAVIAASREANKPIGWSPEHEEDKG